MATPTDRVAGLASYNPNDVDPTDGIAFLSWINGDNDRPVSVELSHSDLAFALIAMVDVLGLSRVQDAIDRIAREDPTGSSVSISATASILRG